MATPSKNFGYKSHILQWHVFGHRAILPFLVWGKKKTKKIPSS